MPPALLIELPENTMVVELGVFPVDIIPPWFSMFIHHLKDEK
jgi:hypothetical protein